MAGSVRSTCPVCRRHSVWRTHATRVPESKNVLWRRPSPARGCNAQPDLAPARRRSGLRGLDHRSRRLRERWRRALQQLHHQGRRRRGQRVDASACPQDYDTIQEAVDAAEAGDLVLVDEGTYNEAVDVTTADITIRGVDRNKVILDGEFELENGIRVLDTDGVVVENMTARNYLSNGFFWTGSDRYRGSYLTAYRNGDYGIYAFDAYHGQFDHSYGSGSPDAGFYIGECFECDAVIDNVVSEHNGLGYSGTNSGGDLYIVNSTFRNNRAGIVPNSGSYELCYPGRSNTIVGNIVHDNNNVEAPASTSPCSPRATASCSPARINNTVERNLVYNHDRTGIAAVPFPEEDASDVPPPAERARHALRGDPRRRDPAPRTPTPASCCGTPPATRIVGNVVAGSGLADLASATLPEDGRASRPSSLDNCFSDNDVHHQRRRPTSRSSPRARATAAAATSTAGALDLRAR